MSWLRISVIIPAFNRAHLIGEAIQSAREQSVPLHEIVVIDDGSTDDTAAVAASYSARVISQPNQGAGAARNRGISESSGDLIAFLDSDDQWQPDRISLQLQRLEAAPPVDLVFAHYREVHLMSGVRRAIPEPIAGWIPSTLLARRRVFDHVGPFELQVGCAEFVSWCARARELGVPMAMLPDVLVTRLVHGGNATRDRDAAFSDYARVIKARLDRRRAAAVPEDPAAKPE